ncbi:ATP-grasp domain-containing protein [Streptomyces jeddahensis]|uniref:Alanine-anticapsin ligase BacD n=1 Tax=Streptomyces jeddahensis TaxID=1716141 RepID=A0A177HJ33_9ACTN|nr:ATP-grasp domain-containing protein [Streptomyces jeddahensis]OAH10935.1 alanine-anticapsin ligase BacD [Streptomyces jeddahensis]
MTAAIEGQPCIVLVDAYAAVRSLVLTFRAQGCSIVRVQSTRDVPYVYRAAPFVPDDFIADIVHDGDLAATAQAVAAFDPVAVISGGEIGVEFADLLAERLGLPGNGTALSAARRDKHLMVEAVRAAGLRAARQLRATDAEELAAFHRGIGGRVVVKPPRSAGSQGVFFCDTPEESVAAFQALVGADDVFSQRNEAAVAQEYLPGTEYMVNTVSRDGRHHVCDVWRTSRVSANGVVDLCDALSLIDSESRAMEPLAEYTFQVLDALGIRHGPAHVEIRMTPDGPCLVEVGARIAGGGIPACAGLGIGESQLEWTVDAYLRPERFHARAGTPYQVRRYSAIAGMISPVKGVLSAYRGIEEIEGLESFHTLVTPVKPGQEIRRTVDDLTYPVIVTLLHDLEEVVQRDLNTIRHLDGAAFYVLDGETRP